MLYGFLRLRLSPDAGADGVFPELEQTALIRELHVYGQVVAVGGDDDAGDDAAQHVGFGTGLLHKAEQIARAHGFRRIAVISGVGTKEYYRKRGYLDDRHFLVKLLDEAGPSETASSSTANESAGVTLQRRRDKRAAAQAAEEAADRSRRNIALSVLAVSLIAAAGLVYFKKR